MDFGGRRGLKRTYSDRGLSDPPRWETRNNSYDIGSRPGAAAYPQYSLTSELASDYPRLTAPLYPSDASYYPEPGKLVLVNPEPVSYSTPYLPSALPPPSLVTPGNGLVHIDDYYAPLNPVVHPPQLAPVEILEPLPRREYAYLAPAREPYAELPPRPILHREPAFGRQRIPPKGRLPPRVPSAPTPGGHPKKKRATLPPVTKKVVDGKKAKKAKVAVEKSKEAKTVKVDVKKETTKDVKSAKPEEKTVEKPIAGMIFGCNDNTEKECKRMQLFGLPATRKDDVLRVVPGTKLFLFNFDTKELSGVYEAVTQGAIDIVPDAFKEHGSFPAQVRTKRVLRVPDLPLQKFKPAIKKNFYSANRFNYELNESQVEKLVKLFSSSAEETVA